MNKLTQEQEQAVTNWAKEGCGLSEIQKMLLEQFGISATYMDVRFMIIDLGVEIKEKRVEPASQVAPEPGSSAGKLEPHAKKAEGGPSTGAAGQVVVNLDRVMKPGSMVSGTVQFSDGVSVSWHLDQFGRLGLDAGRQDYSPTQQDIQAFQQELRKELEKRGF